MFRTDQSDDCGSNPPLGVTVPKFLLLFFDRKAISIFRRATAIKLFSSTAGQDATSSLVHDD